MNPQSRNKTLVIIIGILLLANIATLSFFLMNKCDHSRPGRADKKAQVQSFLKNEVKFTAEQLGRYDELSKVHREKMKTNFEGMSTRREAIFKDLAAGSFSDSAIALAAGAIEAAQKSFEVSMLQHMRAIRSICTTEQLPAFDSGFYRIIAKRGEGKRDKRK